MVDVLLDGDRRDGAPTALQVLFAGGIHDALSAAMVAALAAPLAARGVKVGVLMGTAYLFTDEAVGRRRDLARLPGGGARAASARCCSRPAPGHATRCAPTPFVDDVRRRAAAPHGRRARRPRRSGTRSSS